MQLLIVLQQSKHVPRPGCVFPDATFLLISIGLVIGAVLVFILAVGSLK